MKRIFLILICLFFISCTNQDDFTDNDLKLNLYNEDAANENNSDETNKKIFVHITGEVLRSGVYEMKIGSRVIDVVNEAGGFTANANQEAVNLAEKVKDGIKIYIPNKDEKINSNSNASDNSNNSSVIDINSATKEQLMSLPAVGEKTADSILKYREENEFKNFTDLLKVSGIGKKKLEGFKGLISIGGEIYE